MAKYAKCVWIAEKRVVGRNYVVFQRLEWSPVSNIFAMRHAVRFGLYIIQQKI